MPASSKSIRNGPSRRQLYASHELQDEYMKLEFTEVDEDSGEETTIHGYIHAMLPMRPFTRRTRWLLVLVQKPGELKDARFLFYDSYQRRGAELASDHPFRAMVAHHD